MMPWRSMANLSECAGTLTRRFLAALAAVSLGRSLINKRCCLRFLGLVLASLHGARVSRLGFGRHCSGVLLDSERSRIAGSQWGEVHCLPISNQYKKPRLTAGLHGMRFTAQRYQKLSVQACIS